MGHFPSIVPSEQSDDAQVPKVDLSKGTVDLYTVGVPPRMKLERRNKELAGQDAQYDVILVIV